MQPAAQRAGPLTIFLKFVHLAAIAIWSGGLIVLPFLFWQRRTVGVGSDLDRLHRMTRFVYVGMTGLDPDVRFDKHKAGLQSGRFVRQFGLRLLPEIYAAYNPMSYDAARDMEVELAIDLREGGYGVWQA